MFNKLFGFDPSVNSLRTEIMAGVTTFLTMVYILVVNPMILADAGMDQGALFTATALSAALGTLLVAVVAKMPIAQAPAMGINAFFAYTLVGAMGYSWQTALTATFVEGVIFILLTVFNIREKIVHAIPSSLQAAISVGIGFFIAFIGLKGGGIIIANDATFVALAPFELNNTLAAIGILSCALLLAWGVRGAMFLSILLVTLLSFLFGVVTLPSDFSFISMPQSLEPIFFQFDFPSLLSLDLLLIILILAFVDIFNTLGTLLGVVSNCGYVREDGSIYRCKELMLADAVATTAGAIFGTSTVTSYTESLVGIADGGRTGVASLTTALLFIVALFLSPLFLLVPAVATAGVMVVVGAYMIADVKRIEHSDMTKLVPAFLTIIIMTLSYSIAEGVAVGVISYTLLTLLSSSRREVTMVQIIIAALFIVRYIYM